MNPDLYTIYSTYNKGNIPGDFTKYNQMKCLEKVLKKLRDFVKSG